ncbi:glycoside hydrolase family 78 protein [Anaerobaca lacustris]|uniref:alpha-L-rhamnosidase n=1 Tax=Anaerobaca lacustris TaxID=3044600 RepID=A0AAW6TPW9_9BACT|nr:glycoside hydrolase family 78 protein [Sedimentisphaerales bacterium M17dextr]
MTQLATMLLIQISAVSATVLNLPTVNLPLPTLGSDMRATDLRCEYLCEPLGIDVVQPRLSWKLQSQWRGRKQTAYQVLVASNEELLRDNRADLWNTGKVTSDRSIQVAYAGRPLASRTRCFWKVRVWDRDDKPSPFSAVATWEMGLLEPDDWQAKWITAPGDEDGMPPAPIFRKTFVLSKPVRQARLYICGLGYYEAHLNGGKVGDHVLDPAFTRYDRRALYVTYDVTGQLKSEFNAIAVVLGNGWYDMDAEAAWNFNKAPWRARPTLRCQLEVTFTDGTARTIASDGTWRVAPSPITFNCIRQGETYDARREIPGWNTADTSDANWSLTKVGPGPKGTLSAQMMPPIQVIGTLKPVKVAEPKPGVYVFDLGQNIAGWARLKTSGPAGTKVVMQYAERLNDDGTIDQKDIAVHTKSTPFQTDTYILKGEGTETWEPRFVYHGFQYVQVTGLPGKPDADTIQGRIVHTALDQAGLFECSNDLFNKIQRCTLWAYVGNYHGYPTDCPHREKNGWTGDAHLAAELGLYNFDAAAAYTKWMTDFKDEQRDSGELPGIVPTAGWGYAWGNGPAWDSAYLLIPWYMYQYRDDTRILTEHYERFKRYVDYLTSKADNGIVSIGLGDWVPAKTETPAKVTSTGYYYRDALIVSKVAAMLGKTDDARHYADLAMRIRDAFNRAFFDPKTGLYAGGTQTAMSCALYHGLVHPAERQRVVDKLVERIEKNDNHLDAGILGTKYLIDALTANGRADVVYKMATKTTYPSWGHWIAQGATTLWEQWDGGASRNHIMFGHISAWFYQALAGINLSPDAVGFKHVVIKPQLLGDVTWVRAEHESMYGTIKSAWDVKGDRFTLKVAVPTNTTATVYVPCDEEQFAKEGPSTIHSGDHVRFARLEDGYVVFEVESGTFEFHSKLSR